MELDKAILQIYPDVNFGHDGDVLLRSEDGGDPFIARWDYPAPQPSQAELESAWAEYQAGAVDRAKLAAIADVSSQATTVEDELDTLVTGNPTRAIMLNTEIVNYYQTGRPADPNPNIYVVSNAVAIRRGETLRETLERLFTKWRDIQADVAAITAELDRLIEEINAATTEAEIEAALASATWP